MSFKEIIEQQAAIKILKDELNDERINHAYLITGKRGVGKKDLSLQFIKALMCKENKVDSCDKCISCQKIDHFNHPDVKLIAIEEDSKQLKIDQIRELQREIVYKPYESKRKAYVINDADKMTVEAANSLLKTLEEPPSYVVIILLAEKVNKLLATVISRCQQINLTSISRDMIKSYLLAHDAQKEEARLFSMLADGSLGRAIDLFNDENFLLQRKEILDLIVNLPELDKVTLFNQVKSIEEVFKSDFPFFNLISGWYRDIIVYVRGNEDQIVNYDYLEDIKRLAQEYNMKELITIIKLINKFENYSERNVRIDLVLQVLFIKIRSKRV